MRSEDISSCRSIWDIGRHQEEYARACRTHLAQSIRTSTGATSDLAFRADKEKYNNIGLHKQLQSPSCQKALLDMVKRIISRSTHRRGERAFELST